MTFTTAEGRGQGQGQDPWQGFDGKPVCWLMGCQLLASSSADESTPPRAQYPCSPALYESQCSHCTSYGWGMREAGTNGGVDIGRYLAEDDRVQIKGRVACEINSGDELIATELIFAGAALC